MMAKSVRFLSLGMVLASLPDVHRSRRVIRQQVPAASIEWRDMASHAANARRAA